MQHIQLAMSESKASKSLAIWHLLGFVLVISLNSLAVLLPLNGKSTGELSDQYPNLFTPAGLTFSIWSVIYLFLLGFIIFQFTVLFKATHAARKKILNISSPFLVNCLANGGWIAAWHYEQVVLSVVIMLVLLTSLAIIHERLKLALPLQPLAQKCLLDLPFSLYFGWIAIATIANITALLVHLGWNGAGISAPLWTVIMICIGTILNIYMVMGRNNIAFGLVGIWAFYGIIIKRQPADDENTHHIIFCAQICITFLVFAILIQIFKHWKKSADAVGTGKTVVQ